MLATGVGAGLWRHPFTSSPCPSVGGAPTITQSCVVERARRHASALSAAVACTIAPWSPAVTTDLIGNAGPASTARLAAYDDRMHLPIILTAILPILLGLSQASDNWGVAIAINVVAWLVFVVDLAVHVRLVRGYLKSGVGVFDLAVVVLAAPWFLIPGFGGSQVLAIARLGRLARLVVARPGQSAGHNGAGDG